MIKRVIEHPAVYYSRFHVGLNFYEHLEIMNTFKGNQKILFR